MKALVGRLNADEISAAVTAYTSGGSAREVAAEFGISKTGLLELLRSIGVEPRPRRSLSLVQVGEAVELYAAGWLLREIGELYEVSRDCVRLALKARGSVMRPGLGARKPRQP